MLRVMLSVMLRLSKFKVLGRALVRVFVVMMLGLVIVLILMMALGRVRLVVLVAIEGLSFAGRTLRPRGCNLIREAGG